MQNAEPTQEQLIARYGQRDTGFPLQPRIFHSPPKPSKPLPPGGKPDFLNAKFEVRVGANPYDSLLPPNYLQLLPKNVREAFEKKEFDWGEVPEWVPPMELR